MIFYVIIFFLSDIFQSTVLKELFTVKLMEDVSILSLNILLILVEIWIAYFVDATSLTALTIMTSVQYTVSSTVNSLSQVLLVYYYHSWYIKIHGLEKVQKIIKDMILCLPG